MEFSNNELERHVTVLDDRWVVARQQDFAPIIDLVKQKRLLANNKLSKGDNEVFDGNPFVLPYALIELLEAHGIVHNRSDADYNFVHDFLKDNFPCFMVHPNKNMKMGTDMAVPTKQIVLDRRHMKI